jgi:hypothetical protein
MYTCMCSLMYVNVYMYVCKYVCMYVCMYVCIYVRMCVCINFVHKFPILIEDLGLGICITFLNKFYDHTSFHGISLGTLWTKVTFLYVASTHVCMYVCMLVSGSLGC